MKIRIMILKFRILRLINKESAIYLKAMRKPRSKQGSEFCDKWYKLNKKKQTYR